MALIDYIDGVNRDIYLSADTVDAEIHPIDIYKEMRTLRRTNEALRQFDNFLSARGNEAKGGGKFTERYVICLQGTRIVPYDISHSLTVTGTIITDDGQEGINCFDRSPLTSTTVVDISYVPPQVEVITVNGSGGGGDVTNVNDIANAVAAKFMFGGDGRIQADIVGSNGMRELAQRVTAAVPSPPSSAALWADAPKHLLTPAKDLTRELKAIEQRLSKLAKPAPKDHSLAELRQDLRLMKADLSPVLDAIRAGDDSALEMGNKIVERIDAIKMPDVPDIKPDIQQFVDQASDEIVEAIAQVSRKIDAIEQPDISGLVTKQEMQVLQDMVERLQNYDDAELQADVDLLNRLQTRLLALGSRHEAKLDLLLDLQE